MQLMDETFILPCKFISEFITFNPSANNIMSIQILYQYSPNVRSITSNVLSVCLDYIAYNDKFINKPAKEEDILFS